MQKDAKIALVAILGLLTLVVWTQLGTPGPEGTLSAQPIEVAKQGQNANPPGVGSALLMAIPRVFDPSINQATIVSGGPPSDGTAMQGSPVLHNVLEGGKAVDKGGLAEGGHTKKPPEQVAPKPVPAKPAIIHVVAKGDTYQGLAHRYYKDESKWQAILAANKTPQQSLRIGQKLTIPALAPPTP